jgi:hypothetical protein
MVGAVFEEEDLNVSFSFNCSQLTLLMVCCSNSRNKAVVGQNNTLVEGTKGICVGKATHETCDIFRVVKSSFYFRKEVCAVILQTVLWYEPTEVWFLADFLGTQQEE